MPFDSRFISSINEIDAASWNAISGIDYPFLRHEFLAALELSGSVNAQRGWQPEHLLIYQDGTLVALMPLYRKTHSYGEYVFDWSWAEAYQRHGLSYYPKLICAVPFTPAAGPRLLHNLSDSRALFAYGAACLNLHCLQQGYSGWHVLFSESDETKLWQETQALARTGCQFHWFNRNYQHFDDFLADFVSRKRKTLRKERQKVADQNVELIRLCGDAISTEHIELFYQFYQSTYLQLSGHSGYLTKAFFQRLLQSPLRQQMMLVLAYQDGCAIAGALNFFSSDTLYGRYWGALKDVDCLHFEACYYQGIEFCIEQTLHQFNPGAQGEHKIPRGFHPIHTFSCHKLMHTGFQDALKPALEQEQQHMLEYTNEAKTLLPFHLMHHIDT